MAITGRLTTYPGAYLSEKDFAILIDSLSYPQSGIIFGCGVTVSGTTVTIGDGWISIRGRVIQVTNGTIDVPLVTSGTATSYIVAKLAIYGSDASDGKVSFFLADSVAYDTGNFNYSGGNAYLRLATLTITPTGITAVGGTYLRMKDTIDSQINADIKNLNIKIGNKIMFCSARAQSVFGVHMLTRLSPVPDGYVQENKNTSGDFMLVIFPDGASTAPGSRMFLQSSDEWAPMVLHQGHTVGSAYNDIITPGTVCAFVYDSVAREYTHTTASGDIVTATSSSHWQLVDIFGGSGSSDDVIIPTSILHGVCRTSATVYTKIVTATTPAERIAPVDGDVIAVTFVNGNNVSADNGSLNLTIGNYTYHRVWYNGARITKEMANAIAAGDICLFKYDASITDGVAGVYEYLGKLNNNVLTSTDESLLKASTPYSAETVDNMIVDTLPVEPASDGNYLVHAKTIETFVNNSVSSASQNTLWIGASAGTTEFTGTYIATKDDPFYSVQAYVMDDNTDTTTSYKPILLDYRVILNGTKSPIVVKKDDPVRIKFIFDQEYSSTVFVVVHGDLRYPSH